MAYVAPKTWREVPLAVRAALERPFYKKADGIPGVSHLADVAGWRTDPGAINANWGGPRPVTNTLIGAALGSLGGYGIGRLGETLLPERYFTPGGARKRLALLGGLLGAAPGAYQSIYNLREADGDPKSLFQKWPLHKESAAGLFDPMIPRDPFNQMIMADENTPMQLRAATTGLVEAAAAVRGSPWVSPWDVAKIAVGAGAGLVSGVIAGKTLGLLAGLTPEAQNRIQSIGLWSGALNQVVPRALGLPRN